MGKVQSACIVEVRGRRAAALTGDGRFVRIKNEGFFVGQTVELSAGRTFSRRRARFTALASMAAGFLLLFFGGFASYRMPYGVVSVDVNPSVEFTINLYDRVIGVTGVNDDGQALLSSMDRDSLLNRTVDEAVEQTVEALRTNGYFSDTTENDVVLAASAGSGAHAAALAARLESRISAQSDLTVLSVSVTSEDVQEAHTMGASAGRLYLVERLAEAAQGECEIDMAAWLDEPVREILRETREFTAGTGSGVRENPAPSGSPAPESAAMPTDGSSSAPGGQATPQPGGTGTPGAADAGGSGIPGGSGAPPADGGGSGPQPGAGGAP